MKTDIKVPSLGNKFFDLRDNLPGDAYNWSWERSPSDVKYLVLHHTATEDQTSEEIAQNHINVNGWGGIGYHFLIDKWGQVFYVGDISTARANVANMNEQVIGIGLIGNFTKGTNPTSAQLISSFELCDFFITNFSDLPNVNSWEAVVGHKELPGQATICPGDTWQEWKKKLVSIPGKRAKLQPDRSTDILKYQIENLQTSLGLVEQQRISLQEALQEREKQILALKGQEKDADNTLTIVQALINLYKLILPRRVETLG
ncbi:MAG: N-acetylmuramoyl-L-alanine amidase [Patescibacteria group bacterium]